VAWGVAALISGPSDGAVACVMGQAAFELPRALMAGRQLDVGSALGLAAWLEDGARAILREAALGMLGAEIGAAADEALITAGMQAGEGSPDQMGSTDEWDAIPEPEPEQGLEPYLEPAETVLGQEEETQEIRVVRTNPEPMSEDEFTSEEEFTSEDELGSDEELRTDESGWAETDQEAPVTQTSERDWLAEVSREERVETLEWPAPSGDTRRSEERVDNTRVRHLFPVPEETDWEVGELQYDRDKARVG